MVGRRAFWILPLVLAGCMAAGPSESGNPHAATLGWTCLGGASSDEPCFTDITLSGIQTREARPAIHPTMDNLIAVGLSERVQDPDPSQTLLADENCDPVVYVSQDGGKTWARRPLPKPPISDSGSPYPEVSRCFRDVRPVFDNAGHLYAVASDSLEEVPYWVATEARWRFSRGEAIRAYDAIGGDGSSLQAFVTMSTDFGATWSTPYIFPESNIHPELAWDPSHDRVYALLRSPTEARGWTAEVAWSDDDGASWMHQPVDKRAVCRTSSEPVPHGGSLWFSCVTYPNDQPAPRESGTIQIYRFDPDTLESSVEGTLEVVHPMDFIWSQVWPFDGKMALVYDIVAVAFDASGEAQDEAFVRWTTDLGKTWTEPFDLRSLSDIGWPSLSTFRRGDVEGRMHVLVTFSTVDAEGSQSHETHHVILSGPEAESMETLLLAGVAPGSPIPPQAAVSRDWLLGGGFSLAMGKEAGLIVYSDFESLGLRATGFTIAAD